MINTPVSTIQTTSERGCTTGNAVGTDVRWSAVLLSVINVAVVVGLVDNVVDSVLVRVDRVDSKVIVGGSGVVVVVIGVGVVVVDVVVVVRVLVGRIVVLVVS